MSEFSHDRRPGGAAADSSAGNPVRACGPADREIILEIVNDGAQAYRGVIPPDCWHEPYMSSDALAREIADGVGFFGFEEDGVVTGVMGWQDVGEVHLIRHAYVRTTMRRRGIGSALLAHLHGQATKPVLIGTWAAAQWALDFYCKHSFRLITGTEKDRLLRRYWSVSEPQIAASVVLADTRWEDA